MDDPLDESFALGDGDADTTAEVQCPFCWAWSEIRLDPGSGAHQEYTEDCPVCCRPWRLRVHYDTEGTAAVEAEREGE